MKFVLRSVLGLLIVLALAAAIAALLFWQMPPLHGTLSIDGETLAVNGFGDLDAWQGAFGVAVAAVAVIGAVLIAIVAVVVGLSAAAVGIAAALIAVVGSLLFAAAPLLLVAFVVWLVLRRRPVPAPARVIEAGA